MPDISNKLVTLIIAVVLVSALLPYAITTITATNTDDWSPEAQALWAVVPILVVIGVVISIVYMVIPRGRGV